MKNNVAGILAGTMVVLIVLSLSLFVVDQRQNVIVLRFGEIVKVIKGLV